ncbi:MAG: ABC transporter permease, partial [Akkermansiaceae bacterium]|nr:ABC transporter permease [Armatimonadota bacterium]
IGFSGAVLALYSVNTLKTYGAAGLVGGIVALSIVRETGPILTGVAIAARAGSAITAEIGSMKVSEQIDALRSMAITPVEYLVKPRLIASLIMLPLVTVFADIAGVVGGAIVAASKGVSWTEYLNSIQQLMEADGSDISKGLLKTVVFGAIIALVGCREGLETEGGASGVGQSTTRSVVIAIVLIFISDFLLTFLLFNKGIVP